MKGTFRPVTLDFVYPRQGSIAHADLELFQSSRLLGLCVSHHAGFKLEAPGQIPGNAVQV